MADFSTSTSAPNVKADIDQGSSQGQSTNAAATHDLAHHDQSDDIQVKAAGTVNENNDVEQTEHTEIDFVKVAKQFGVIGKQLADTYSEENQETREGFVQALKEVKQLEAMFLRVELGHPQLSMPDKEGLVDLCRYLQEKIEKRMRAASDNSVNY